MSQNIQSPEQEDEDQEDGTDDGLGSYIYRLSETSSTETFKWKSLLMQESGIFLSSIRESRADVFVRKVSERVLLEKRVVLPWPMLSQLMIDDGVMQIDWFDTVKGKPVRSRLKFQDMDDAKDIAAIVANRKNWNAYSKASTVWRGMLSYAIGLVMSAGLTWLLLNNASKIEQGLLPDVTGRRAATKLFFWKVAGWLGTTGCWVVGILAMGTILALAIRWYRRRQPAMVWRKAP